MHFVGLTHILWISSAGNKINNSGPGGSSVDNCNIIHTYLRGVVALKRHIVCQIRVNLDTSEVPKLEWHLKSSVYGKSQPELLKIGTSHSVAVLGGFFWFLRTTPFQNSKTFLLLSSS